MPLPRRSFLGLGMAGVSSALLAEAAEAQGGGQAQRPGPGGGSPEDPSNRPFLEDWRGLGGDPSDTSMVQAALNWAKANSRIIHARAARYGIDSDLDLFLAAPASAWGMRGETWQTTIFECRFEGYDRAVFNGDAPVVGEARDGSGRGQGPILDNVRVEFHPDVRRRPIAFSFQRVGNLRLTNYSVQFSNNCQVRLSNLTNSDCDNLVAYGGGHCWSYKNATDIRFSIKADGRTLRSDLAHFDARDLGRHIHLEEKQRAQLFRVERYLNPQSVEVAETARWDLEAAAGAWESARCSIAAGDSLLYAEEGAAIWSPDDRGREILVTGADQAGRILRATISEFVSADTVRLDRTASTSVDLAYLAVPAVLLGGSPGRFGVTNDFTHPNLQIERFRGVGLACLFQTRASFPAYKIHGEPQPHLTAPSTSCLWISASDCGFPYGTLESQTIGPGKILAMALGGALSFGRIDAVMSDGEKLCTERSNGRDGVVVFEETINILNNIRASSIEKLFDNEDTASPKIRVDGLVQALGAPTPEFPINAPGGLYRGWWEKLAFTPVITGTEGRGSVSYTAQEGGGFRLGDWCFVRIRVALSVIEEMPTGDVVIEGLPYSAVVQSGAFPLTVEEWQFGQISAASKVTAAIMAGSRSVGLRQDAGLDPILSPHPDLLSRKQGSTTLSGWYQIAS